jgi:hypothetical protein
VTLTDVLERSGPDECFTVLSTMSAIRSAPSAGTETQSSFLLRFSLMVCARSTGVAVARDILMPARWSGEAAGDNDLLLALPSTGK